MDEFTTNHLRAYADSACFDDEREAFFVWAVNAVTDDPLLADYGWAPLLVTFRNLSEDVNAGLSSADLEVIEETEAAEAMREMFAAAEDAAREARKHTHEEFRHYSDGDSIAVRECFEVHS